VALLVYDITRYDSFKSCVSWLEEIRKHTDENIIITLVGNKRDLEKSREVSVEEATDFAGKN
jgi:GTPase SAR1 family protein